MGIKLVIVDDAPFIREAIRSLLSGAGVEFVGEAADGEQAVKVVLEKRPDVVIMDMVLPIKNGVEAAKEILQSLPSVKIIACSTQGQESMVLQAINAGCSHFVNKPFSSDELIKVINQAANG